MAKGRESDLLSMASFRVVAELLPRRPASATVRKCLMFREQGLLLFTCNLLEVDSVAATEVAL